MIRLGLHTIYKFFICLLGIIGLSSQVAWGHIDNPYHKDYLLILNSYTNDAPWSNAIISPVQHWGATDKNIPVFTEHMNMLLVNDSVDVRKLQNNIFSKYGDTPPKAILLLGNSTLILRDEIRKQWGDMPLILCGEDNFIGPNENLYLKKYILPEDRIPITHLAKDYNLTFLQAKLYVKKCIELMQQMIPGMKKLVLIGDHRYVNEQLNYDTKQLLKLSFQLFPMNLFLRENILRTIC